MDSRRTLSGNPAFAATVGVLLTLPFFIMNVIVAVRPEPIYSWLRSAGVLRSSPMPTAGILLTLGTAGAVIVLAPLLRKQDGARPWPVANTVLGGLLLAFFLFVSYQLGLEMYRCEVLPAHLCD